MSSAKGESEGVAPSLLRDAIGAAPAGTFASDYLQQMCKDGSSASALAWLAIGLLTGVCRKRRQHGTDSAVQPCRLSSALCCRAYARRVRRNKQIFVLFGTLIDA